MIQGTRGRGFTLLELIVVIAILSILAGAALPVASRVIDRAARASTREELAVLAEAALEHARDTLRVPGALADLERRPTPALPGWSGPYLARSMADPRTGAPGFEVDGWSRPYVVEPFEHGLRLVSLGRDGVRDEGGDDDLAVVVDLRPVLRERTLETVGLVNRALDRFHASPRVEPLAAAVPAALAALVEAGFLPEVERYRRDAWGVDLVADPLGRAPLVRVRSSSLGGNVPTPTARGSVPAAALPPGSPTSSATAASPAPRATSAAGSRPQHSEAWRRLEERARARP